MKKPHLVVAVCLMSSLALSATAQLPDPVIYMPFDTSAGDFSGNFFSGELLGGASITAGGVGNTGEASDAALDLGAFNNGAYVNVPGAAEGAFDSVIANDSFTISLWTFGNDQQPQSQWGFRAQGDGNNRVIGSHIPWGDGTVYFDVAGCCGPTQRISAAPADPVDFRGQWNHYAFVKDTIYSAVYINGDVLIDSDINLIDPLSDINEFVLGSSFGGGGSYGGMYDDFALFDEALTADQISSLADGEQIPVAFTPGDFDDSGAIDEADFNILATNLGAHLVGPVTHAEGDFDLNSAVDLNDFRLFKEAFPVVVAQAQGIPEPASIGLALMAIVALLPVVRRHVR